MVSLQEIQKQVEQAQEEIRNYNFDRVKTGTWPGIRNALSESDLEWEHRGDMAKLIYKHLNEQNLQGGPPTPINLQQLKAALQSHTVQVSEPARVYKWLPW